MILEAGQLSEEHLGAWVHVSDDPPFAGVVSLVQHASPMDRTSSLPVTTIRSAGDEIEVTSDRMITVLEEAPF